MTTFTGTSSIALTWDASGQCRGVYLERVRDRCCVRRYWEGHRTASRSVAETLADGLRSLEPGGTTIVVAGGDDLSCGFIDLEMPALRPDELRNALTFELRRCAPVPDEKLVWAYRLMPGKSGPRVRVRLYYLRQAVWERWTGDVSGLTHGLDVVMPPSAALDPVLSGVPVVLGSEDTGRFLFVPGEGGRRDVQALAEAAEAPAAFGAGSAPLDAPVLQTGALGGMPAARQATFAAAVVLAMYGLSHTLSADRRTGFELPYELRTRRHRQSRLIAVALALYTAAVGLYGLGRLYADSRLQYSRVHAERLRVEAQIEEAGKRLDADEAKLLDQLRTEVADLSQPRPSMAVAIAEITRRVGRTGWCTSFRWNEGAVDIQLRESEEIEDLERTLEQSPVLGDVSPQSKKVQAGVTERKVAMNARYDIGNERSAPPPAAVPQDGAGGDDEAEAEVEAMEDDAADGAVPAPPRSATRPGVRKAPPAGSVPPPPGAGALPPPPPPPP